MRLHSLVGILCVTVIGGCGKASKGKSESGNTEATVGGVSISDDPLKKLNLSASLAPTIPASVTATGTGVQPGSLSFAMLAERKKSREACNIRQKIKEAKMNQDQMAMDLCFIEAQTGMKAGGKYKMKFTMPTGGSGPDGDMPGGPGGDMPGGPGGDMPGGPPPMSLTQAPPSGEMTRSVYLDNSNKESFKVFMCDDGKLTQKIVLSGASEKGSKGSYKASFSQEGFKVQMVGAFDNGVGAEGRQKSFTQMGFDVKQSDATMYMRSSMQLDLSATAVSTVKVAHESSASFGDFAAADKEIGVALIGPVIGSGLFLRTFTGTGSFPGGPPPGEGMPLSLTQQVETSRTFFDNKGQTLTKADSESFADGGILDVKESMFPKLLPADFKVEFEPSDWDCSGTVDFAVNLESEAFKGCEAKFTAGFSMESCDGTDFELGAQVEGLDDFAGKRDPAFDGTPNFDPLATQQ